MILFPWKFAKNPRIPCLTDQEMIILLSSLACLYISHITKQSLITAIQFLMLLHPQFGSVLQLYHALHQISRSSSKSCCPSCILHSRGDSRMFWKSSKRSPGLHALFLQAWSQARIGTAVDHHGDHISWVMWFNLEQKLVEYDFQFHPPLLLVYYKSKQRQDSWLNCNEDCETIVEQILSLVCWDNYRINCLFLVRGCTTVVVKVCRIKDMHIL